MYGSTSMIKCQVLGLITLYHGVNKTDDNHKKLMWKSFEVCGKINRMTHHFGQYESLHNHTALSDGEQSYQEVLSAAEEHGYSFIAFTDHDVVPSNEIVQQLNGHAGPVEWEIGIEVTSGLPSELGGGAAPLFHILGLRLDISNHKLQEYCREASTARLERLHRTVDNLKRVGFTINVRDCLELAGQGTVGSPHISRALLCDPSNILLLERIADDMRVKSQQDDSLAARYKAMIDKVNSKQRHPYIRDLLFADDAYLPDVYVPYLFCLDMDRTVRMIRAAGGVAVLAHWPTVSHLITPEHLKDIAEQGRIDGVELRTVYNADSDQIAKNISFLQKLADDYELIATVGIDGHSKEDFGAFSSIPGALDMTVGQRARYLGDSNGAI